MAKPIHSMIRVLHEDRSIKFYEAVLGLHVVNRYNFETFTLIYMADPTSTFEVELTVNKDRTEPYNLGDGYGHIAVVVEDVDAERTKMEQAGAAPTPAREFHRDGALFGKFFFVKDPDGYSIEVLQRHGRFG